MDPSLTALVGSMLAVVLLPVVLTYLVGHLALAGGLLIGIGLSQLPARLHRWDSGTHRQSSRERTADLPVWYEGFHGRQQATAQTSSD